jgi:large subunit ribosomal protein L24e
MPTCSFCSQKFSGRGKMFVFATGKILNFCSSKCEKNMLKLKREPRYVKWLRKKAR